MAIETRVSVGSSPIKDAAGLHGVDIGYIYEGVELKVDTGRTHDGWYPIVGPIDLGPTWKKTGKEGWIEATHTRPVNPDTYTYLMVVNKEDGMVVSCTRVG